MQQHSCFFIFSGLVRTKQKIISSRPSQASSRHSTVFSGTHIANIILVNFPMIAAHIYNLVVKIYVF